MFSYRKNRNGNNMITIKEYAEQNGVTAQSVYKRINSKKLKDRLKGHVVIEYGVKCLDDVAVAVLNETKQASTNTLSLVKQSENIEEINKLKEENERLKDEIIAKQDKYETVLEQLLIAKNQIAEKERQLIEYKTKEKIEEEARQKEEQKKLDQEENKGNWFRKLFRK